MPEPDASFTPPELTTLPTDARPAQGLTRRKLGANVLTISAALALGIPILSCGMTLTAPAQETVTINNHSMDDALKLYSDVTRNSKYPHTGDANVNTTLAMGAGFTSADHVLGDYKAVQGRPQEGVFAGGFDDWEAAKVASDASMNGLGVEDVIARYHAASQHDAVDNSHLAIDIASASAAFGVDVQEVLQVMDQLKAYKGDSTKEHLIQQQQDRLLVLTLLNGGNMDATLDKVKAVSDIGFEQGSDNNIALVSLAAMFTESPQAAVDLYNKIFGQAEGLNGYNTAKLVIASAITGYSAEELVAMYRYGYNKDTGVNSDVTALLTLYTALEQPHTSVPDARKKAALLLTDLLLV